MNMITLIAGIVAILVGVLMLALSKASRGLVQSGEIPPEKLLWVTLPSGNKIEVLFILGLLSIVPGLLLIVIAFVKP